MGDWGKKISWVSVLLVGAGLVLLILGGVLPWLTSQGARISSGSGPGNSASKEYTIWESLTYNGTSNVKSSELDLAKVFFSLSLFSGLLTFVFTTLACLSLLHKLRIKSKGIRRIRLGSIVCSLGSLVCSCVCWVALQQIKFSLADEFEASFSLSKGFYLIVLAFITQVIVFVILLIVIFKYPPKSTPSSSSSRRKVSLPPVPVVGKSNGNSISEKEARRTANDGVIHISMPQAPASGHFQGEGDYYNLPQRFSINSPQVPTKVASGKSNSNTCEDIYSPAQNNEYYANAGTDTNDGYDDPRVLQA
eukprot:Nk52_evm6s377 gene=Nk52_evmTU6s377